MKDSSKIRLLIRQMLFENNEVLEQNFKIENIDLNEKDYILSICDSAFNVHGFKTACSENPASERVRNVSSWKDSIKLTVNGEIVGYYLFSHETPHKFIQYAKGLGVDFDIKDKELYEKMKTKNGVEGVSVGVKEEHKGKGYGKKLLEYPKNIGVDYIWGIQSNEVSDIKNWIKRRELLASADLMGQKFWITVEEF